MHQESSYTVPGRILTIYKTGGGLLALPIHFTRLTFGLGGRWRFIMHGPDKGHYHNECEFIQIIEPALIAWDRISKPLFQVVATFEELAADKTSVVFKQLFHTASECNKVKKFVADKNEENFDRLETELVKMRTSPSLIMVRSATDFT